MELLNNIILTIILVIQAISLWVLLGIERELANPAPQPEPEEAKVTDPFQKPKEIYSSTSHIIVPKTPTEIRNQNYDKIKKGVEYGDIARG